MKEIIIPPVFVFLSTVLIILFFYLLPEYNLIPFPFNLAGLVIAFLGFRMMGKTRLLFKKHNTTLSFEKSNYLITEGAFSKTRNPMYIAMFILLIGLSICFMNVFSIISPILFILIIHLVFIPEEEKMMEEVFGRKYIEYKEKVKRWI